MAKVKWQKRAERELYYLWKGRSYTELDIS
ncbi:hypothetical protein SAMN04488493_10286 [Xylanibacter ruminicola]|nr:hypothetical protein SAMN04488493_10286 [Xylanibacter ruminicola]